MEPLNLTLLPNLRLERDQEILALLLLFFDTYAMATTYEEAKRELMAAISRNIHRGSDIASGFDKALISLSGGALVFSMTFVTTLAPQRRALLLLFFAWIAFSVSIITVLYSMRSLQSGLSKTFDELVDRQGDVEAAERAGGGISIPTKKIRYARVEALNQLAIGAFLAGVLLLGLFVGYNLWVGRSC